MVAKYEIEVSDAATWLRRQPAESFDGFYLDPPYGVNFKKYRSYDDSKPAHEHLYEQLHLLTLCHRALKPGGSIWFLSYPEVAADIWAHATFANRHEILTWVAHSHTGGKPLRKGTRLWLWLSKGQPKVHPEALEGQYRNPTDRRVQQRIAAGLKPTAMDWVLQEQVKNSSAEKRDFPCQIPQSMVERLIMATTDPGDLVGDCFLGSGTTALAAVKLDRRFKGCDMDPASVELSRKAVEALEPVLDDRGDQRSDPVQMTMLPSGNDGMAPFEDTHAEEEKS